MDYLKVLCPIISPLLDFPDRDVIPTRDDLRALPLESRNLWSQRSLIHVQDGILVRDVHTNTQLVVPTVLQNRLMISNILPTFTSLITLPLLSSI